MIKINLLRDPLIQSAAKGGAPKNEAAENPVEAKMETKDTSKDTGGGGKQSITYGILCCLLFSCLGGLYYMWLNRSVAAEQSRSASLSGEKDELKPYLKLEGQFREQSDSLRKKEEALAKLKKQQQLPVYFLQELANSLPDNVWFARLTFRGAKVEIRGEALTEDAIYQFRDNLASRDQWFRNVNYLPVPRQPGLEGPVVSERQLSGGEPQGQET